MLLPNNQKSAVPIIDYYEFLLESHNQNLIELFRSLSNKIMKTIKVMQKKTIKVMQYLIKCLLDSSIRYKTSIY